MITRGEAPTQEKGSENRGFSGLTHLNSGIHSSGEILMGEHIESVRGVSAQLAAFSTDGTGGVIVDGCP